MPRKTCDQQNYAQSHGKEEAETVWNNYVYGDWTQENTSARLASGLDQLEFVEQADFTALTTSQPAVSRNPSRHHRPHPDGTEYGLR